MAIILMAAIICFLLNLLWYFDENTGEAEYYTLRDDLEYGGPLLNFFLMPKKISLGNTAKQN
jgi:hypothetical protein